jgi:hypothetical protein
VVARRSGRRGSAHDEMSVNVIFHTFLAVAVKNSEQGIKCYAAKFRPREPDCCQRRLGELAELDVIESYNGDVLGHSQTRVMNGA